MGGKAFDNVEPIPMADVIQLISWFTTLFNFRNKPYDRKKFDRYFFKLIDNTWGSNWTNVFDPYEKLFSKNNIRPLGSTGKKYVSGDVDFAVSDQDWTYDALVEFLSERVGAENLKKNPSINQVYTRILVPSGKWHQVDFMLGNVELLSFTHWSPSPMESKYSGSHRTELIKAVAKALSDWTMTIDDEAPYNAGEMVARLGYTLNHDKGLSYGGRFAPLRKDGQGYTKKMIPVTAENVNDFTTNFFPEQLLVPPTTKEGLITKTSTDPKFITKQLFGGDVTPDQLNTYEGIVELIQTNPGLYQARELIWDLFVARLIEIGQPIPDLKLI
jgi:hypothetical protein